MATTIKAPVNRPARRQHRRFPVLIAAGVALVLAVTAALIFVAVWRGPAPAPGGYRTGTPVVVPHPAPGPFGS
jgi:hypothetical protein